MTTQIAIEKPLIHRLVTRSSASDLTLVIAGSLVTALLAQVAFPMWPVPITGQTLAVLLVGSVLGATRGALSMILYISLGAAGLPVFSGAASGLTFGPTFGYLAGFVAAAALIGYFAQLGWHRKVTGVLGSFVVANLVIYAFGLTWLSFALGSFGFANDIGTVLAAGLLPFLIGDAIKIALAVVALPLAHKFLAAK